MRRVLVPLDGTDLAASILPDARRLAGPDGTLVLIQDVGAPIHIKGTGFMDVFALEQAENYLEDVAENLRADGMNVEVHAMALFDAAYSIARGAAIYDADMIACATHGRGPLGRLIRGGIAWTALAHSTVPILLRHPEERPVSSSIFAGPRRIMAPLDGSPHAEKALPLAQKLAGEWGAELVLVRVVASIQPYDVPFLVYGEPLPVYTHEEQIEAINYLRHIAEGLTGPVKIHVPNGTLGTQLVRAAKRYEVTDVVMSSHGRTGLSRALLGSVTDDLLQQLHCPIIVIPALAAEAAPAEYVQEESKAPATAPAAAL